MDAVATKYHFGSLMLVLAALTGPSHGSIARTGECAVAESGRGVLSSSLYPSDTPSNQRCQWTLTAYPNKVIGLYIVDFDLSRGSVFEIHNGSTVTNSSFLTSYTGDSAAKLDVNLEKVVTLVFRSSALTLGHRGFLLMYYSTDTPERSDDNSNYVRNETIVGGGSLSSPGYSGWYPSSARYTWTLRSCEVGAPLKLVFDAFSLELYDHLIVYEGDKPIPRNFRASFTGNELPPELTLGSVATVVFISDSVGVDTGFTARFSTVIGSNVITADYASMKRACSASCPTNVVSGSTYCYAHDDPHMRTFDGLYYEHQKQGIFYLYKHDAAPISVQAVFEVCNEYATCSCAVGVRYWDELFVVDRCNCMVGGSAYRPNRAYKLGSGSMMKIEQRGLNYEVSLPNGLRIVIGQSWAWIGAVDLYPSYGDQNVVQGLCGLYNGNPNDDGTYRCGFDVSQGENPWETWRVPEGEVVFTASMPRYAFNMSSCNCSHVSRYTLPHGVLNATGLPASEISNSHCFPVTDESPSVDRPWMNGWTPESARQYCEDYIEKNDAIRRCEAIIKGFNLAELKDDCVRDIYLTGGTAFALTALEASKQKCINELPRNTTDLPCQLDCSQRGKCVNGTCRCNAGFYGAVCATNPAIAPHLRSSTVHPGCSPNSQIGSVCNQEQVFGETFYDVVLTNPKCKINATTYALTADGAAGKFIASTMVISTAIYESTSAIICQLPVPASNSTSAKMVYAISVTNDGLNYSNSIFTNRTFIPPCGGYRAGFGALTSPNYPQEYKNDASCLWNLTASANNVLELTLVNFVLKEDGDRVQVFDQGCSLDNWTGTQPKQSFVYGPTLVILFTSSASGSSRGFNVSFNSVAKAVSCGGSVVDHGILLSPNYPSFYTRRTHCVWKLFAGVGKSGVSLKFNAFNTEAGYDYLNVFSGTGSTCTPVDKLSGDNVPSILRLGSSATIIFRTDDHTEMSGFNITFSSY